MFVKKESVAQGKVKVFPRMWQMRRIARIKLVKFSSLNLNIADEIALQEAFMRLRRFGFSILAILFIAVPTTPAAMPDDKTSQLHPDESEKRKALWKALLEALPEKYREIDVYAENPALTQVCFRSKNATLLFNIQRQKVEEQNHAKMLPRINRITYREVNSGGVFLFWCYGQLELSLYVDK